MRVVHVKTSDRTRPICFGDLCRHWEDFVGPQIALVCWPRMYATGRLVLEVTSQAWRLELKRSEPQMIASLPVQIDWYPLRSIGFFTTAEVIVQETAR